MKGLLEMGIYGKNIINLPKPECQVGVSSELTKKYVNFGTELKTPRK
jgi:hypothetical protein